RGGVRSIGPGLIRAGVSQLVDAAGLTMDAISIVFVTFARVGPIQHVNAAIGAVVEVNTSEPRVFKFHEIGLVFADGSGTDALETFLIDAPAMEIESKEAILVLRGPTAALINHEAAMRVAAAQCIGAISGIPRIRPFLASVPMIMIRGLV